MPEARSLLTSARGQGIGREGLMDVALMGKAKSGCRSEDYEEGDPVFRKGRRETMHYLDDAPQAGRRQAWEKTGMIEKRWCG